MNGGLASPAARRSPATEPASRRRADAAARAPVVVLAAAPLVNGARDRPPSTRDRMQTSFGAGEGPEAAPALAVAVPAPVEAPATRERIVNRARAAAEPAPEVVPALPVQAQVAEAPTARERIVNRARAVPEPAPAPREPVAVVVDLAAERELRRPRQTEIVKAPAKPPAKVIVLPARPAAAGPAQARAPPAAEPSVTPAPEPSGPEATAETAETEIGPAAVAAPSAEPSTGVSAPESAAAPEEAAPAAPEGAAEPEPEPEPTAEAQPPAAEAPAPEAPPPVVRNPEDEPGFQAMKQRTQRVAGRTKTHQPAPEGAATAQAAAVAPANDVSSQAAGAQVEVMGEQEPGVFDAQAFIAAVKRAVEAATPSTLEDADEFKESGKVGQATAEIQGLVKGGKESSENDIETATVAPPDPSVAVPKPEADMVNDEPGSPAPGVGASDAMPGTRPPEQTDLSAGPAKVDAEMASANVTDEQIARSNEPDFSAALDARQKARDHAATAPAGYRAEEEAILAQGREAAAGDAAAQLQGMHGTRSGVLGKVLGEKEDTKSAHEAEHARVANEIEAMYTATKDEVQAILDGLDQKVDDEFTRGEEAARTRFENYVDDSMREYKNDRYDRIGGGLLWLKDKIAGMPDEVNEFYERGRADYLTAMDAVILSIANIVGAELTAARARIVEGRAQIRMYVETLDENLRGFGEEAERKLSDKFDELNSEVDSKQDELVDAVARRYVESRDALDARIEELQAANKGLVAAALDAVVGVIKTILALGEMLLRVLARAAEVVGDIISDPIGFLGNLIDGVMGGLKRFVSRIGTHLQNALFEWLFGTLGGAGITVPAQLDGAGILDLVTQVIGLTYANIRARVARIVGEPVVAQMEQTVDVFKTLVSTGVGGLWEFVKDKVGDIADTVLGKIKDYLIERVIEGGIAWIIGLLNPVAAFIKACKAIYQIVMFIAERAKQIMEFVDAILDSISAIAKGNIGAAVEKVEAGLAKGLVVAIGFLASLLGLGDLSEKIKSIVAAVRRPIEKAIDAIVFGAAKVYARTLGRATGWAKAKVEAGKAWATGKVEAAKEWTKGKAAAAKELVTGKPPADEEPHAAEPLVRPVAAAVDGALHVDEDVSLADGGHRLKSQDDPTQLVLRSGPVLISTVQDPTLQAHYQAYVQAVTTYNANLAAFDDPQRALQLGGATEQARPRARLGKSAVDRAVAAIRGWIDHNGVPPTDAPGLGDVRPYAQQQTRFADIPIWRMEAEHVIPNGYFNALLEGMHLRRIEHGDEYQQMSTVMIYERAAEWKTSGRRADEGDVTIIRRIKSWARRRFDDLQSEGGVGASFEAELQGLISRFETDVADTESRTLRMVDAEQRQNGTHRGHAPGAQTGDFFAPRVNNVMGRQLRLFNVVLEDRLIEEVRRRRRGRRP